MRNVLFLGAVLAGLVVLCGPAQAHIIIVDGNDSDWTGVPPGTDSFDYDSLEAIWTDAIGDDQGDCGDAPGASDNPGPYTYPDTNLFLGTEADVKEWRVTANLTYNKLYFLIRVDYQTVWTPFIGICVDLDHVSGSGQGDIGGYRGRAFLDPRNEWEYLIHVRDNFVLVQDTTWNTVPGTHQWVFNTDSSLIEVGVDVAGWPISPWDSDTLYFTVYAGLQDFGNLRELDSLSSLWQGGGGLGTNGGPPHTDPCVYDLCFVTAAAQCVELSGYTDTSVTNFSLDVCQPVIVDSIGHAGPDTIKPHLVWVEFWTCDTLIIHYDEPMDSASAVNTSNYHFAPTVILNSLDIDPPYRVVWAYLGQCLAPGINFSLTVDPTVTDTSGNGLDPDYDSTTFGIAQFVFVVADTADTAYAPGYLFKGSYNTRTPHSYDASWGSGALYDMYDDGAHGDGAPGDHIWGGVLLLAHDNGYNTWEWGVTDLDSVWIDGNWQFQVPDASPDTLVYTPPRILNQPVRVVFSVDMSSEPESTYAGGVSLQGSQPPLDWTPGSTPMNDLDADSIFSASVIFPYGSALFTEYKYTRVDTFVGLWQWETIFNRNFYIDDTDTVQILPTDYWNLPTDVPDDREHEIPVPQAFLLGQNYPNPFNPETQIDYQLASAGRVTLNIYNILGRKVRTLIDAEMGAGFHRARWDGRDDAGRVVPSAIYLYRLEAGDRMFTRKMILIR